MKKLSTYPIILIILLIGCKSKSKDIEDTYKYVIELENNLGFIKTQIPNSLDTNKRTVHFSDYRCGDEINFVFYNKDADPLIPDTTGEWGPFLEISDSVKFISLTFTQFMHPDCFSTDISIDKTSLDRMESNLFSTNKNTLVQKKDLINIGDNKMAIIMYTDSAKKTKSIRAQIIIKNEFINIGFTQLPYKDDGLSEKVYECIKRIEIFE